jgi:hypothetical protein
MDIVTLVTTAALSVGVNPDLLLSVCMTESGLRNVHSPKDGHSPSYGPCQIKLETAHRFNKSLNIANIKKPEVSTKYAALYLEHQLKRYDNHVCRAVLAYNQGSAPINFIVEGVDNKVSVCHTKYVTKVMEHLRTKSWKRSRLAQPLYTKSKTSPTSSSRSPQGRRTHTN